MMADAFWRRTVGIFAAAPVKITLISGGEVVGKVFSIDEDYCTIQRPDGGAEHVYYSRILQVIEATPKL